MMEIENRNWVDIISKEFSHPATALWRSIEVRHLEEAIKKYNTVLPMLDLGCAEGKIGSILFKERCLFGLDNCWDLIKQNQKTDTYKALVLADACQMPFGDGSFSCIFSNSVIEHIPDLQALMAEVARVLKKGGLFIFTVPSNKFGQFLFFHVLFKKLGLNSLAGWYSKKRNSRLNHFHCHSHNVWQEKLNGKGFRLLEYAYYMPKKAVMLWDFLATAFFMVDKIQLCSLLEKKITLKLRPIFEKYLNQDCGLGGGLLIIAVKN